MIDSTGNSGSAHDEDLEQSFFGEGHPVGLPTFEPEVGAHLRNRRKINSPGELLKLQELVHFKASHGRWSIGKDLIGLIRRGPAGERDEPISTSCAERPDAASPSPPPTASPPSTATRSCSTP